MRQAYEVLFRRIQPAEGLKWQDPAAAAEPPFQTDAALPCALVQSRMNCPHFTLLQEQKEFPLFKGLPAGHFDYSNPLRLCRKQNRLQTLPLPLLCPASSCICRKRTSGA